MTRNELVENMKALPEDELFEVLCEFLDKLSRKPLVGVHFDPSGAAPTDELLKLNHQLHKSTAVKMVDLGLFITDRIRRYVERGYLASEVASRESWPCSISFQPRQPNYFKKVLSFLEDAGLGTRAVSAATKASRSGASSNPAQEARALLEIIGYWGNPSAVGQMAKRAREYAIENPDLVAAAKKLPPFSTACAWKWWETVARPLAERLNPALKRATPGPRSPGAPPVDPKINAYRKQLGERFLDLAPGTNKSRSGKK